MRLTPLRLAFFFVAALLILGPATAFTQPGGGKGKQRDPNAGGAQPGGGGQPGGGAQPGGARGGFDPNRIFDLLAPGKDSIDINSMPTQFDPNARQKALDWAQKNGITNGQLTRDQFGQYMQEAMAQRGGGGNRGPGGAGPGGPGGGGYNPPRDYNADAEASFRRFDKRLEGKLEYDDMPPSLQAEWEKWDTNHDGAIDLAEYKDYYKARQQFIRGEQDTPGQDNKKSDKGDNQQTDPVPEDGKRPTVYRAGHLPKELPQWFEQLDTDKDGQVGLYEWKKGNMNVTMFQEIDKNGDGFLTVEEVLRWQKTQIARKKDPNAPTAGDDENPDGTPSDQPKTGIPSYPGGGKQRGFGPGGPGGQPGAFDPNAGGKQRGFGPGGQPGATDPNAGNKQRGPGGRGGQPQPKN